MQKIQLEAIELIENDDVRCIHVLKTPLDDLELYFEYFFFHLLTCKKVFSYEREQNSSSFFVSSAFHSRILFFGYKIYL